MNHVDALKEQIQRIPRPFPTLVIDDDGDEYDDDDGGGSDKKKKKTIDDFVFEDFKIVGYDPHKSISMKMAV